MNYNDTSIRLPKNKEISKTDNTSCCQGYRAVGNLIHCSFHGEWYATLEDSLAVTYKTKYSLTMQCSNHTAKILI